MPDDFPYYDYSRYILSFLWQIFKLNSLVSQALLGSTISGPELDFNGSHLPEALDIALVL